MGQAQSAVAAAAAINDQARTQPSSSCASMDSIIAGFMVYIYVVNINCFWFIVISRLICSWKCLKERKKRTQFQKILAYFKFAYFTFADLENGGYLFFH